MSSTRVNAEAHPSEVLRLSGFGVDFHTPAGTVRAAAGIDLAVARGECLGVVGESGAGKSQVFLGRHGALGRERHARTAAPASPAKSSCRSRQRSSIACAALRSA